MTTQTTYNERPGVSFPGVIQDMQQSNVFTKTAEGQIGFGVPAVRGTDPATQCVQPTAPGSVFLGITVRDRTKGPDVTDAYPDKQSVAILDQGSIYVTATRAVTAGQAVTFDATDATFGADAVAGNFEAVPDAVWDSTAGAGEIAVVKIR